MITIPFGLIGALWGHYVYEISLSMFSIIGLIGMTGIIINDAIVLISTYNMYNTKMDSLNAILVATVERLRPILLTTLTTVFGLAPLLFENSRDAQFLKPTVITLVFGLGFGMMILLILVPSLVAIQSDGFKLYKSFVRFIFGPKINGRNGWKNIVSFIGFLIGATVFIVFSIFYNSQILFTLFVVYVCLGLIALWVLWLYQVRSTQFFSKKLI